MKIFYAVQNGDNFDWDNGSENKAEAIKMAEEMAQDEYYDGQEIRIAVIECGDDWEDGECTEEIIIRDGWRVRE